MSDARAPVSTDRQPVGGWIRIRDRTWNFDRTPSRIARTAGFKRIFRDPLTFHIFFPRSTFDVTPSNEIFEKQWKADCEVAWRSRDVIGNKYPFVHFPNVAYFSPLLSLSLFVYLCKINKCAPFFKSEIYQIFFSKRGIPAIRAASPARVCGARFEFDDRSFWDDNEIGSSPSYRASLIFYPQPRQLFTAPGCSFRVAGEVVVKTIEIKLEQERKKASVASPLDNFEWNMNSRLIGCTRVVNILLRFLTPRDWSSSPPARLRFSRGLTANNVLGMTREPLSAINDRKHAFSFANRQGFLPTFFVRCRIFCFLKKRVHRLFNSECFFFFSRTARSLAGDRLLLD